uniref:BZIP domain-containing protein n=1 Tax=Caenorhabditis tropicalis TaxID=1561998 RepID=A0A1I7TPF4_9PELO
MQMKNSKRSEGESQATRQVSQNRRLRTEKHRGSTSRKKKMDDLDKNEAKERRFHNKRMKAVRKKALKMRDIVRIASSREKNSGIKELMTNVYKLLILSAQVCYQ